MRGRIPRLVLWTGLLALFSSTVFAQERWIYRYNGPADTSDVSYSIALGADGNLCAAGYSRGIGTESDFTVVSLTDSGVERWVYRYDGPAGAWDGAQSVVTALDGNIYAAGSSWGNGTLEDFTVVSLTDSGVERWVYRYDGPMSRQDAARSIAIGPDGNVYAAGNSVGNGGFDDFAVVSLSDSGSVRWVYRYDGPGGGEDLVMSIAVGLDGNLYAAGSGQGETGPNEFTVVSLKDSGSERWIYRYDGSESGLDWAASIVMGSDGNLYAAGQSDEIGTSVDFLLVSLSPEVGVEEHRVRPFLSEFRLPENFPNPFYYSTTISYSLPIAAKVTLSIYDITGRLVETLVNYTQQPGIHEVRWDRKQNPSGVYFYRFKAGEFEETRKMVVVE
jgi:hypothetical protein